jgi:hypothetical protein
LAVACNDHGEAVGRARGGAGQREAVTRMSFRSPQRREKRTTTGRDLPVLANLDNHNRIIVDLARLS